MGLLTLTRPEGLVLAGSLGIIDLWRHRKINTGIMISMGICALICLPWFAYLLVRTGNILPTSAVGKQVSSRIGLRMVFAKTGKLAFLGNMPGLVYPFFWLTYVLEFALGGMALPSPDISLGKLVGNPNYTISVWAILIWLIVVVPLVWIALRRFAFFMRETPSEANGHHWLFSLVAIWVVLHNLVYMFFLPIPGTASRYGAINHMVLWILLALGLYFFHRRSSNWRWVGGGLLILVLANSIYWNNVYDANIEHMNNVRKTAAYYLRDHFSSDDFCAAFDVGAVRFFSQRPVMDLGGLVDSSFGEHYLDGSFDQFLVDQGVSCLIIPGSIGAEKDGWFDFASALGLTQTPLFTLSQVSLFEIDYELWLVGFLPTNNYQASVTIYDLVLSRVPE
ncbi:MAG: hypothetical protein OEZ02_03780 [Anaerolineae bacterium]|nr:hypothetical protein [Anaerolineae bacterium]